MTWNGLDRTVASGGRNLDRDHETGALSVEGQASGSTPTIL